MNSLRVVFSIILFSLLTCSTQVVGWQVSGAAEDPRFELFAEYLYWQVSQDEMQYAAIFPDGLMHVAQAFHGDAINLSTKLRIVDPRFQYNSGFRIGMGYDFARAGLDCALIWTRLHQNNRSKVFRENLGVLPLNMPVAAITSLLINPSNFAFGKGATSKWRFEFDVIELQIGKCCACSVLQNFVVRPYLGVEGAIIRQKQRVTYTGFFIENKQILLHTVKKNDFQGVGPSTGVDIAWGVAPNWLLSSSIGAALLYGEFDVKSHPSVIFGQNSVDVTIKSDKRNRVRPTVNASLGLDWDSCFCGSWEVTVGVAYEVQYWWNQWQASPSIVNTIVTGGTSPQGDLMMQGLTVHAGVSF